MLITGGARRVGAAMALYFAEQGYDIALHYNRSKSDAQKLQKQIQKLGRRCELFLLDLQKTKAIPALMAKVKKSMPHCSVLVNNASIFERGEFMDTDEALFDRQMAVNFKAPFFLTQAFAKTFGKGCVVNMLDTDILRTRSSHFAYLLAKKMFADFTAMAARVLGPDIRVNAVAPCVILPSIPGDAVYMKKLVKRLPLQRVPTLEEVAQAAYMLCENEVFIGQVLYINGGEHVL